MIIHIAKKGQPSRQYTLEQVNNMLARGELSLSDTGWYEGLKGWVPLNKIPGIQSQITSKTSLSASDDVSGWGSLREHGSLPSLWNPRLLRVLVFPLTAVWGAVLSRQNWRSLGKPDCASQMTCGIWFALAFLLALIACSIVGTLVGISVATALELGVSGWITYDCQRQLRHVAIQYDGQFFRKKWLQAMLVAIIGLSVCVGSVALGRWVLKQANPPPSTEISPHSQP